jgi:hypothetical protein
MRYPGSHYLTLLVMISRQVVTSTASLGLGNEEAEEIYYNTAERGFGEFYVYGSCFWVDHFRVSTLELLLDNIDIVKFYKVSSKKPDWADVRLRLYDCAKF